MQFILNFDIITILKAIHASCTAAGDCALCATIVPYDVFGRPTPNVDLRSGVRLMNSAMRRWMSSSSKMSLWMWSRARCVSPLWVTVQRSQVFRRRRAENDLSELVVDTGRQRHKWISFSPSVKSPLVWGCRADTNRARSLTDWNACCLVRPPNIFSCRSLLLLLSGCDVTWRECYAWHAGRIKILKTNLIGQYA